MNITLCRVLVSIQLLKLKVTDLFIFVVVVVGRLFCVRLYLGQVFRVSNVRNFKKYFVKHIIS